MIALTTTRLHITPFNSDLLTAILGAEGSKLATNISYHILQTFPEKCYGYLDLPKMEAEKVKRRINGAILKGKKITIEEARLKKRKHVDDQPEDVQQLCAEAEQTVSGRKRSKRDRSLISGAELPPSRKIERGWTKGPLKSTEKTKEKTTTKSKPKAKSKYTDKDEVLFRAKVPKNKTSRSKKDETGKKKEQMNGTEMVHEFEKSTTIPSFLRASASAANNAAAYEDGTGWVDAEGNIVEQESQRSSRRRKAAKSGLEKDINAANPVGSTVPNIAITEKTLQAPSSPSATDTSDEEATDSQSGAEDQRSATIQRDTQDPADDDTSSSGSSDSDLESDSASDTSVDTLVEQDSADEPSSQEPLETVPVHPLEALFKKPVKPASSQATTNSQDVIKPSLEVQTSFSFFNNHDDNDDLPPMPMTPFSSQDLRTRELRSAAPTPDTAHPSRMSSIFNGEESEGDLSEMEDGNNQEKEGQQLQVPQTPFRKAFFEKRGENRKAIGLSRRKALKLERQAKNRTRRYKN